MKMKNNHLIILLCFLLASCSVTKNLPEGEKLYVGIDRMEVLNEDKTDAGITALTEVEASLAYPPNNAVFGPYLKETNYKYNRNKCENSS